MPQPEAAAPPERAADHTLVVPDLADSTAQAPHAAMPGLAAAWFSDAAWLREPSGPPAPRPRGARFRGATPDVDPDPEPGVLRLGERHTLTGPFPVDADRAAALGARAAQHGFRAWTIAPVDPVRAERTQRPATYDDRDGLSRAFAAGLPEGEELRVVRWAVAVARKLGGAVLVDGRTPLAPDPGAAVDLSLYSAHALDPADLLGQVRGLVATAEPEERATSADGSLSYAIRARTSYDGDLRVRVAHVDRVPRALGVLEWRAYGPFAYHLSWIPQDPDELRTEHPSGLHLIARGRMSTIVARLATALQARIAGVLVDDGGFVATGAELAARVEGRHHQARAWV
ncbi:hypothetical protein [Xylanimonas ulmi]|uniref:Uncharacterized protein n=1 Tax=Xylanimonas ulmi TaxID=228973 RepID=A0A4Q7M6Z1_9MICO|nr:hypothetical protein [Xylanibacterium ulmi]RZS62412.1 hypothetical protein EV386_2745 [Xylanibacterium ulmi]